MLAFYWCAVRTSLPVLVFFFPRCLGADAVIILSYLRANVGTPCILHVILWQSEMNGHKKDRKSANEWTKPEKEKWKATHIDIISMDTKWTKKEEN